ncbi:MAG TPA: hypothetical protein VGV15_10780, partial [Terriglobales bacterium]|nr:hypothetical protein [Terriglobales bacterium]
GFAGSRKKRFMTGKAGTRPYTASTNPSPARCPAYPANRVLCDRAKGDAMIAEGGPMRRYIDDQWRDILAAHGFSPRTEEETELWGSPGVDALIQITHSDEGNPVWFFYGNRTLAEVGDESERLLHLLELAPEDEYVEHEKELNVDDNQWLTNIGISLREVTTAFHGGTSSLD